MDFLELCKRVRQDSGVSGEGPATTISQTGILARIVKWTEKAHNEVQKSHPDWTFLRRSKSTVLVANERAYTPEMLSLEPLSNVKSVFIDGEKINVVDYDYWLENLSDYRASEKHSKPNSVTVNDIGYLEFHPTPDQAYTLDIVYQREPSKLTENTDSPLFNSEYHEVIVSRALMFYADYEEDMYRYQRASFEYELWLSRMADKYLPQINMGRGNLG